MTLTRNGVRLPTLAVILPVCLLSTAVHFWLSQDLQPLFYRFSEVDRRWLVMEVNNENCVGCFFIMSELNPSY